MDTNGSRGEFRRDNNNHDRRRPSRSRSPAASTSSALSLGLSANSSRMFGRHGKSRSRSRSRSNASFEFRRSISPARNMRGSSPGLPSWENVHSREASPVGSASTRYSPPPTPTIHYSPNAENPIGFVSPARSVFSVMADSNDTERLGTPPDESLLPRLDRHCSAVLTSGLGYTERKLLVDKYARMMQGENRSRWDVHHKIMLSEAQMEACLYAFGVAMRPSPGRDPREDEEFRTACFMDCAKLISDMHHYLFTTARRRSGPSYSAPNNEFARNTGEDRRNRMESNRFGQARTDSNARGNHHGGTQPQNRSRTSPGSTDNNGEGADRLWRRGPSKSWQNRGGNQNGGEDGDWRRGQRYSAQQRSRNGPYDSSIRRR